MERIYDFFDKRYLYVEWQPVLDKVKCIDASNSAVLLHNHISHNDLIGSYEITKNLGADKNVFPFLINGTKFRFIYYDPNWKYKLAWLNGDTLQYSVTVENPRFGLTKSWITINDVHELIMRINSSQEIRILEDDIFKITEYDTAYYDSTRNLKYEVKAIEKAFHRFFNEKGAFKVEPLEEGGFKITKINDRIARCYSNIKEFADNFIYPNELIHIPILIEKKTGLKKIVKKINPVFDTVTLDDNIDYTLGHLCCSFTYANGDAVGIYTN